MRLSEYTSQRAALTAAIAAAAADYEAAVTDRCAFDLANPGPAPLVFDGRVNGEWDELGNWWEDAARTVPATSLPETGESVHIINTVTAPPGVPVSLDHAEVLADAALDGVTAVTLRTVGVLTGTVTVQEGAVIEGDQAGVLVGTTTFKEGGVNSGTVQGDAEVHHPAPNPLGGTVTGTVSYVGYPPPEE